MDAIKPVMNAKTTAAAAKYPIWAAMAFFAAA